MNFSPPLLLGWRAISSQATCCFLGDEQSISKRPLLPQLWQKFDCPFCSNFSSLTTITAFFIAFKYTLCLFFFLCPSTPPLDFYWIYLHWIILECKSLSLHQYIGCSGTRRCLLMGSEIANSLVRSDVVLLPTFNSKRWIRVATLRSLSPSPRKQTFQSPAFLGEALYRSRRGLGRTKTLCNHLLKTWLLASTFLPFSASLSFSTSSRPYRASQRARIMRVTEVPFEQSSLPWNRKWKRIAGDWRSSLGFQTWNDLRR